MYSPAREEEWNNRFHDPRFSNLGMRRHAEGVQLTALRQSALALAALAALAMASTAADACNCNYRPKPKPRADLVRVEMCMTPEEWRACPTKSWYASIDNHRFTTLPKFRTRCGTVWRPAGHPAMYYRTAGGRDIWFVF